MEKLPSWLVQTVGVLLGVLIIVVIISQAYAINAQVKGTAANQHTITITATGMVTAVPDLATIDASVQVQGATATAAAAKVNTQASALVGYLKVQGIAAADITTQNYNINPSYNYNNNQGTPTITGYTANETVEVKVHDLTKVPALLDGTVQNGANSIDGTNYTFSNPDEFTQQAREQALANAKTQAQALASAAGVSLGKLVTFSETSSQPPIVVPYQLNGAMPMAAGAGGAMAIPAPPSEPGSQQINADVSVTYAIN